VEPFPYLVALQRHHEAVARDARAWMPWNYEATLAAFAPGAARELSPRPVGRGSAHAHREDTPAVGWLAERETRTWTS
jgi:hypothetical protein